jgi:hypothetical protein
VPPAVAQAQQGVAWRQRSRPLVRRKHLISQDVQQAPGLLKRYAGGYRMRMKMKMKMKTRIKAGSITKGDDPNT